jgi:predicted Fe-Mo cluster-binding NifX family protein
MSKIFAISSTGKSEKSFLDLRFGKCENVVIYDDKKKEINILENPYKNSDHSGTELIKFLKNEGVSVIITGEVGPHVSSLLEKEKLQLVLLNEEKIKIEEVIERLGSKKKS